ncbi:hypothetical protein QQS21_000947 [Conoideocrella luteorostrata]|uniref:Phytase-like domain-containing protein n=1 Tax=Conoideocrella luteorostrata TaxID=1105319 RepID=A0AAJ0FYS7_9HYPO|nr:hypothetical protein QQS21_000947 [Conoideocrella luteorostrata]
MVWFLSSLAPLTIAAYVSAAAAAGESQSAVFSTTCEGKPYTYNELAGYGFVASDARDKFGDSISLGSSIAFASWAKKGSKYEGKLYGLPDRGWNTQGTVNFQPRVHEFLVTLTPAPEATVANPSPPNVAFTYLDSILLKGPDGAPATGLDADQTGGLKYPGYPILPAATYKGDGFGGDGPGGKRVTIDAEALVLEKDGGFWISDEYGPYVYKFDKNGTMTAALAPPDAILPLRNGTVSFSSNTPPIYDPKEQPVPGNPTQGRQNNQGFEGMTISPDGKSLFVLLQSATRQDGGQSSSTRRYTRLLQYAVRRCKSRRGHYYQPAALKAEYVVPLPTFTDAAGKKLVAAQSEMHFISDTQFLFLPRDSNNGHGQSSSQSVYRHVDVFDISTATNVKGPAHDAFNTSIASTAGVLNPDIKPATVCPFIDMNLNAQLNRFRVHNGGPQDSGLLNEKWEGLALVPVNADDGSGTLTDDYFLFVSSDNDFVSQRGFTNFGRKPFSDASGYNLDNQMLVFKITLPKDSKPLVS